MMTLLYGIAGIIIGISLVVACFKIYLIALDRRISSELQNYKIELKEKEKRLYSRPLRPMNPNLLMYELSALEDIMSYVVNENYLSSVAPNKETWIKNIMNDLPQIKAAAKSGNIEDLNKSSRKYQEYISLLTIEDLQYKVLLGLTNEVLFQMIMKIICYEKSFSYVPFRFLTKLEIKDYMQRVAAL